MGRLHRVSQHVYGAGSCCSRYRAQPEVAGTARSHTDCLGRNDATTCWREYGRLAWVLWGFVHIYLLVGFEHRLLVVVQWFWAWLTYGRGARLITR